MKTFYLSFIVSLSLAVSFVVPLRGDDAVSTRIPGKIEETLQQNVQSLDPFTITWTQQRSSKLDIQTLIKRINAGSGLYNFLEPQTNIFAWQGGNEFLYTLRAKVFIIGNIESDAVGRILNEVKRSDVEIRKEGETISNGR